MCGSKRRALVGKALLVPFLHVPSNGTGCQSALYLAVTQMTGCSPSHWASVRCGKFLARCTAPSRRAAWESRSHLHGWRGSQTFVSESEAWPVGPPPTHDEAVGPVSQKAKLGWCSESTPSSLRAKPAPWLLQVPMRLPRCVLHRGLFGSTRSSGSRVGTGFPSPL